MCHQYELLNMPVFPINIGAGKCEDAASLSVNAKFITSFSSVRKPSSLDPLARKLFLRQKHQTPNAQHAESSRNTGLGGRSSACRSWPLLPPCSWIWTCTDSGHSCCLLRIQGSQYRCYVCFHPTGLLRLIQGSVVYL
jgi:hypothetical protein